MTRSTRNPARPRSTGNPPGRSPRPRIDKARHIRRSGWLCLLALGSALALTGCGRGKKEAKPSGQPGDPAASGQPASPTAAQAGEPKTRPRDLLYADLPLDAFLPLYLKPEGDLAALAKRVAGAEPETAVSDVISRDLEVAHVSDPGYWFIRARALIRFGKPLAAATSLKQIFPIPGVEPRLELQCWAVLRRLDYPFTEEQKADVLGIVIEWEEDGTRLAVAAYRDGETWMHRDGEERMIRRPADASPTSAPAKALVVSAREALMASEGANWREERVDLVPEAVLVVLLTPAGTRSLALTPEDLKAPESPWTAIRESGVALKGMLEDAGVEE